MYLYSVIIPHKDSLDLLRRCVASVPVRDDIQIIVVDDGSDISQDEWDSFKKEYSRVELYLTKEGRGAGIARNVGLSYAKGKWVVFADADDFFYEGAFGLLDNYSESGLDILYFLCDSRNGETLELIEDRIPVVRKHIEGRDFGGLRYQSFVAWGKMIRRQFIEDNHIRFDDVEVSEDVMFAMKLGYAARNVEALNVPLYCCTANIGSLTAHRTVHRVKTNLIKYKEANNFLHDHQLDDYRWPFEKGAYNRIKFFFPRHPRLFIWGLWKCRYKGAFVTYLKDVLSVFGKGVASRIKNQQ